MESFCLNSNSKENPNPSKFKSKYGGISTKLFGDRKPMMKHNINQNNQVQLTDFDCILKKTRDETNLIKKQQRVSKSF